MTILAPIHVDPRPSATVFRIRLAATAGWDVWRLGDDDPTLVAHVEDWHRLERTVARFGHYLVAIDAEIA